MNEKIIAVVFSIALILSLSVSGCISPPIETPLKTTTNKPTVVQTTLKVTTPTATPTYVTISTPYMTPEPTSTLVYRTVPIISPVKEDYVIIYSTKNQPFVYNKTAVSFDLKNPPMLIDFKLADTNITRNISGDSRVLKNLWTFNNTKYSDPNAYFEVTVREKSTGTIVLQDGFGQRKQYGTENTRHLKVFSAGDYLIEFGGNNVTANIDLSVKREGNIN
jgi:hypothetical protein